MGAQALRDGNYSRSIKLLLKSLKLYRLPGVEALLSQAQAADANGAMPGRPPSSENNSNASRSKFSRSDSAPAGSQGPSQPPPRASYARSSSGDNGVSGGNGTDGRAYTQEQVTIVSQILRSKRAGGRDMHYRVLSIDRSADDAAIKKAYRKLSLKVHPDKNSAPQADEAFKAVGLAYATLSDPQKRTIYDRYGEEDPDNRGGGGGGGPFGGMHRRAGHGGAQEVNPEEIFNMFFGGGMGGMGGPGFHMYTNGFGPGVHFGGGGIPRAAGARRRGAEAEQDQRPFTSMILQFLPIIVILLSAFLNSGDDSGGKMAGVDRYFSLTVSTLGSVCNRRNEHICLVSIA
jgi:DnaJ homolog subfamily B member 12